MSSDVESRLYRAESWIKRATESSHHLDGQLIFHWIALNALYGQRGSESGPPRDREDLHTLLGRIGACGGATAVSLMQGLASLKSDAALLLDSEFLYEEYWGAGYTDSLATTIDRATRRLRSWPSHSLIPASPVLISCPPPTRQMTTAQSLCRLRQEIRNPGSDWSKSARRFSFRSAAQNSVRVPE